MHTARRWLLGAVLLCAACGSGAPPGVVTDSPATAGATAPGEEAVERGPRIEVRLRPPDGARAVTVRVEDAHDQPTRRVGLMHRRRIPPRGGMVFRFPDDRQGGFWMKDTLVPLSIAFFDGDGEVLAVLDMQPCQADPCPSYDPEVPYRGALEVNQGFFDRVGLQPGWRVELPGSLPAAS
ncbi:MAG: DUF192 domain-containing protein [Nitriliruptorales bacterium]|nr:DUF192 domain-containing protein [Nitriliruptorales bacterium]